MFQVRSLFFSYNEQNQFRFPDIDLDAGENLLILGDSGIGKTTFLHLMAGLLNPEQGSVALLNTTLQGLTASKLDQFRGQHIGIIYQRPHFIRSLSLDENLALVQHFAHKRQDPKLRKQLLESLNIEHKRNDKPHRLSQGEQQRASIALALINRPELVLADEPTSSLDDKNCMRVINLLKEQVAESGAALIIITHDHRLKEEFANTIEL